MKILPAIPRNTNKTGVTGVAITDGFCHSYIVTDSGRRKSRKFSVAKYGEYEALRLAIQWRRDNELEIHGYSVIPASLVRKNFKHQESSLKANQAAREKKMVSLENRQKQLETFTQRKKEYYGTAGKYIYRIDDFVSGHGWLLRIEFGKELVCNLIFRDGLYGSASEALRHAQKEREKQLALHNVPYVEGRRFRKKLHVANSSGVTGVSLSGDYYHCYIPVEPNVTKRRKFSVSRYGEKVAFQLAVEWRKEMELEVYGAIAGAQ